MGHSCILSCRQTWSKQGRTLGKSYVVSSVFTSRPLRHPSARRLPLAGFIRLEAGLPPPKYGGGGRTSGPRLRNLSPHADGLTPGSRQVLAPSFFPAGTGLPQNRSGSACIPSLSGLSRSRTLSAMTVRAYLTRLHHSLYATACGFGWHPGLSTTPVTSTVAFAAPCRGKFSRPVTRTTRPQPTHPKRATGVAISLQIARSRS